MSNETYLSKAMPEHEYFCKMKFSEKQLNAVRELYYKYIEPLTKDFQYLGYGTTITWSKKGSESPGWYDHSFKNNERQQGYNFPSDGLREDTLWEEFEDILPFMNRNATLTIMPPMTVMLPHVDRPARPNAIYFPISGCTNNCFSEVYHLPKNTDPAIRNTTLNAVPPLYSYNVIDNAYIMNTQEWHGVRNLSRQTRIAIGWNCRGDGGDYGGGAKNKKTFPEIRDIFTTLGYIDEQ